jgi:insulin receptor substrate 1
MYQGSSSAHSRASSLAEENTDAYVPMTVHAPDSYVEMDGHHHHHHHHHTRNDGMSSAASSCSITSGTPSTDMRFSEYPLEKVVSAFAQSEDDECNADMRPLRTYSVGSRLEHNKRKMRVDVINAEHISSQSNPRVRAFSVGSRAKVPRSELYKSPLTQNAQPIGAASASTGAAAAVAASKKGKKSSSAPILVKFPGSIDRMDDLMEIDYSKNSSTPVKTSSPVPVPKVKHYMSDGIDMSPRAGRMGAPSGYVEMKPGNVPAKSGSTEHDYLDMTVGGAGSGATTTPYILSGSPIIRSLTATSPKEIGFNTLKINNNNNDDYIDMSPKTSSASFKSMSKHNTISESPKTSSDDYLNMSPGEKMLEAMGSLPKSNDSSSAPDGYMEMSWHQNKHKTGSDSFSNSTNFGKLSSQPINIQAKPGGVRPTKVLATATAVPGHFLPPGQTNNGQSGHSPGKSITARCDSRDSGIATPSGSHPTMFAFSPSSPKKPFIVPSSSGLSEVSFGFIV